MNVKPIIVLAAAIVLVAVGCGGSDTPPSGSAGLNTRTPTVAATRQPSPTAGLTATPQPAPTAQPTVQPEPTATVGATPTPEEEDTTPGASGIQGQALMGPMCPVVRSDEPCPDQPVQAAVEVMNVDCTNKITSFVTDADGRFRVALQPGEYCLVPRPLNGAGGFPFGKPQDVIVRENAFTAVIISLDTGIR